MSSAAAPPGIGDPGRIGRYLIEGTLGRGAMGVIYRAHDPDIDRPVAIKLIRADLLDGEERSSFIARFRREAQAAGRCAHPNIVAIYDFALHEGNPFLAMELVNGMTLGQARQGRQLAAPEAVSLILQVLAALGAAHALGVVHRDIKPANIMLTDASQVKVTDFGISRIDTSALTAEGVAIGTPSYMSPEQCRGEEVDGRSDLFSAGAVLYELLAGAKPFAGGSANEVFARLLHGEATDLSLACPGLPESVRAAVMRSLAKAPAARFPTADAMAEALRSALTEIGAAGDRTVVLPARASPGSFDPEIMDTLERKLAHYVGPIARYLVQSAARTSSSVEVLCASLAANVAPESRDRFQQEMKQAGTGMTTAARTGATRTGATPIPGQDLERLQTELARYVGPVARVLIKRALPGSASAAALWRDLSAQIEAPADRAAFLKKAPPS